jgi:hypothetical protein
VSDRSSPSIGLQGFGESDELEARPLDHLLEIEDELPIYHVVGGVERIERCLASRVKDLEHAELLPNLFIHMLGIPSRRTRKLFARQAARLLRSKDRA